MNLSKIVAITLFLGMNLPQFAEGSNLIPLDNLHFQKYNNFTGKWIELSKDQKELEDILLVHGVFLDDVKRANGIDLAKQIPAGKPVFIPYSESYKERLLREDKGRQMVESNPYQLLWPIQREKFATVTSHIGKRNGKLHTGVDIACKKGTLVYASQDGQVEVAENYGAYGKTVIINHEAFNNIKTVYAHNSLIYVKPGDKVLKGQIIALSGSTGLSTGPHVHFEVRYKNIFLNPEELLPNFPKTEDTTLAAR